MSQFEFSDAEYARQLDEILDSYGAGSAEFAARKAIMLRQIMRSFGPAPHLSVLDVGCGPGLVSHYLAPHIGKLVSVDSSPPLLEAASQRYPELNFQLVEEGAPLPFEDGTFELAFFSCVLHHVPPSQWESFLHEVSRVVKPGGLVVCIEHNPWNPLTRRIVNTCPFDQGVTLLSAPKVGRLFKQIGLRVEKTDYHVFFPGRLRVLEFLEKGLSWCPVGGQHTVVGRKPTPSDDPIDWLKAAAAPDQVEYSLVLPFFNEIKLAEQVVSDLYNRFAEEVESFEMVLVDNGCIDGTSEILQRLASECEEIRVVRVFPNRGYGWGILHGLAQCRGRVVGFVAGDGQIRPSDVIATFRLFDGGECDMAQVRRMTRGDGPVRQFISFCWNTLFSMALGRTVKDGNGTPKVFSRAHLPDLRLQSSDWYLDSELWMKALSRDWRIAEHPVDFLPRDEGDSHVRWYTLWEFVRNTARWMARYRRSRWKKQPL